MEKQENLLVRQAEIISIEKENDIYYLNDVFDEDIMRYHNHEAIRDLIKEDFKEWILINKKNG